MAASLFAVALNVEKNSGMIMVQVIGGGSSLLSAFHGIQRACVRDISLFVVQHVAEVNLNQPL